MEPAAKKRKTTWRDVETSSHAAGTPCMLGVCMSVCVCACVCVLASAYGVYMDMYLHFGETFIGEKLRLLKEKLAQTVAKQKMTTASSSSVPPNLG